MQDYPLYIGKHAQSILDCYLRSVVYKNEQIDIFHVCETIKCIFQRTRLRQRDYRWNSRPPFSYNKRDRFFNFFNARRLLYLE